MNQIMDTIQEVEDVQAKVNYGIAILVAIHEAMLHGDSATDEYRAAVFGVYEYLDGVNKELAEAISKHYDAIRAADSPNVEN